MNNRIILILGAIFILLLAACTGAATEAQPGASEPAAAEVAAAETDEMMSELDDAMAEDNESMAEHDDAMTNDDETMAEHNDEMMEDDDEMMEDDESANMKESSEESMTEDTNLPAWQTTPLTNAQTGEQFTLADFAGKTVYVEPMATWCTNCRRQLTNVSAATSQFDDNVVFIALSVEIGIQDSELAAYAEGQGFPFIFAGLDETLLNELAHEFGQTIANPPATPHFIIRADGTATELVTGIETADEIAGRIQAEIQ